VTKPKLTSSRAIEAIEIIDKLGGATKVASLIRQTGNDMDRVTVQKWKTNGIPWRWLPMVTKFVVTK